MALRKGVYIVPTDRWYIERTVWLIAGLVLLVNNHRDVEADTRVGRPPSQYWRGGTARHGSMPD